jgi:hypothetical protein
VRAIVDRAGRWKVRKLLVILDAMLRDRQPWRAARPARPSKTVADSSYFSGASMRAGTGPVALPFRRRPERLFSGSKPRSAWVLGSFGRIGLRGPLRPVKRGTAQVFVPDHRKISKARPRLDNGSRGG